MENESTNIEKKSKIGVDTMIEYVFGLQEYSLKGCICNESKYEGCICLSCKERQRIMEIEAQNVIIKLANSNMHTECYGSVF